MAKQAGTAKAGDMFDTLRARFEGNMARHPGLAWETVRSRLEAKPAAKKAIAAMEESGGEPDVIAYDGKSGDLLFCDCSPESPAGRRSLCYDAEALASRKEAKPAGSAVGTAEAMGVELLDEAGYRRLQELGEFDLKTSSWIRTPDDVRKRGGALFSDRRYGRVFVYHNGAESYYGARGWRGTVRA